MAGIEPAMRESKSRALTAWLHPYGKEQGRSRCFGPAACSGVGEGTRTLDTRNHNPMLYQLNYAHHMKKGWPKWDTKEMARLKGLEPLTHCLEGSCSIHLSYRRISFRLFSMKQPLRRFSGANYIQNSRHLPEPQVHMERVMGIEPTRPAWKAGILPLNYTRIGRHAPNRQL